MVTQGNQVAQKTPKKTFKQPKIAMGQKMIGDPKMAMQQHYQKPEIRIHLVTKTNPVVHLNTREV